MVVLAASCGGGSGDGTVLVVTVDTSGRVPSVERLRVVVTNAGRSSEALYVPLAAADLPPPRTFSLGIPASRHGVVRVDVEALRGDVVLSGGFGEGSLDDGQGVRVVLPGVVVGDLGADADQSSPLDIADASAHDFSDGSPDMSADLLDGGDTDMRRADLADGAADAAPDLVVDLVRPDLVVDLAKPDLVIDLAKPDLVPVDFRTPPDLVPPRCDVARASCRAHRDIGCLSDGAYLLEPPGGLGSFMALCDMTTDGGGWTLVLQGAAGDAGPSYYSTGDVMGAKTFKFSDAKINAIRAGGVYRLRATVKTSTLTRFVSGACTYAHATAATGACLESYGDVLVMADHIKGDFYPHHKGISDYVGPTFFTTVNAANGDAGPFWYVETSAGPCTGKAETTPCSFGMWVR